MLGEGRTLGVRKKIDMDHIILGGKERLPQELLRLVGR